VEQRLLARHRRVVQVQVLVVHPANLGMLNHPSCFHWGSPHISSSWMMDGFGAHEKNGKYVKPPRAAVVYPNNLDP
jgi:hypothetical protein